MKAPIKKVASSSDSSSSESESDSEKDTILKKPQVKSIVESAKSRVASSAKVDSSSSDGSSSEADSEPETKRAAAKAKTQAQSSSSSSSEGDSDDSDSSDQKGKPKPASKGVNGIAKSAVARGAGSSDSSDSSESDEDSDEESKPAVKFANGAAKATGDSDSESSSDSNSNKKTKAGIAAKGTASSGSEESVSDSDSSNSEESGDSDIQMADVSEPAPKPTISGASPCPRNRSVIDCSSGKRKALDEERPQVKKVKLDPAAQETKSIFVGRLSWSVDNDRLAQEFAHCGEVVSATVQTDRNTGKSRGFGYVHFSTTEAVEKALQMSGQEIDGRAINVDRSTPPNPNQAREKRTKSFGDQISPPSHTLFVANLPFTISEDTLWSYFEGYSVKTIRLPTDRETGQPKGFGYVELEDIEDAKNAFEALSGTEIEGRRIRLDYSQPRDSFGGGDRGGRGGWGGGRGRGGDRGGRGGDRGGRGGRGIRGRGAPRGTAKSGGITAFEGRKVTF